MRRAAVLLIALPLVAAACTSRPTYQPVASVSQLMHGIVVPSSDALWAVAMEPPNDEEQWTALQNRAMALAEVGSLLLLESRSEGRGPWIERAQELTSVSLKAFQAAESHDLDALLAAGDEMAYTCEGCHMLYLPESPSGGATAP